MSSSIQTPHAAFSYDATAVLGFGQPTSEVLPEARPGEIVLRYGGWSLQELRSSKVLCEKDILADQDWYDAFGWSAEKLPSGLYVLRLPVPNSNRKNWEEQQTLLFPGEESAPVVLAASALLSIHLAGGQDPLAGGWTRCREQAVPGIRVKLYWRDGRLRVSDGWDGIRGNLVWLSSARGLPS